MTDREQSVSTLRISGEDHAPTPLHLVLYTACPTWGDCSARVPKHRDHGEIPGCFFSAAAERSYDRSIARFIKDQQD
ncbi:hypothetical protein [Pelobacter seleniigenes]|uniref:hypothetical protein n=1 Tax=Pelobacter seleniigenes TaxID=407188 RepID=UPI001B80AC96|nr:hypothetical protein [Pelobacter seleniigenes]